MTDRSEELEMPTARDERRTEGPRAYLRYVEAPKGEYVPCGG
jgi:hypothetical protein